MNDIKREIVIKVPNNDEKIILGSKIHDQLKGRKDYIDDKVILNIDGDCEITVTIFDDCKNVPEIII